MLAPVAASRPVPNRANARMLRLLDGKTCGGMPEDLAVLRAMTDRPFTPMWLSRLFLASVRERSIPGPAGDMRLRLYRPRGRVAGTVLFLHGGGFVHCGLDSHDGVCCRLARASGCVVASLEYRLAPEHPFPAATEDAFAALRWVTQHAAELGNGPVAVAGDSAGANLAAVVCQMAARPVPPARPSDRDPRAGASMAGGEGVAPPAFQLLYYPCTHGLADVPSRSEFAEGHFLTTALMQWYLHQYLDVERHAADPRFAPFLAPDLRGLPPALVITAECDPLRDEGAEYAKRLRQYGVAADYCCYPGTIHGFINFYALVPDGRRALAQGGRAIRKALDAAKEAAAGGAGAMAAGTPDLHGLAPAGFRHPGAGVPADAGTAA